MRVRRHASGGWEVSAIHPFFAGLLAELPQVAAHHENARGRLYPEPAGESPDDEDLRHDWATHVRPELERLFASSRDIVARDLASLVTGGRSALLVIPAGHVDAWLNALNQARLAIAEQNGFGEEDLNHAAPMDLSTRRGMDLLRMHFYADLQELLVGVSA